MKQKTEAALLAEVRRHTIGNRREIEASKTAGCVSCCAIFNSNEVQAWQDEWTSAETRNRVKRWSAKCPQCGQPSIIGNSTGLLNDQAYLPAVKLIIARRG